MSYTHKQVQASINQVMTELDRAIVDAECFGTPGLVDVIRAVYDKAADAAHAFHAYSKQKGLDKHER